MNQQLKSDQNRVLKFYGIESTPIRIETLKAIYECSSVFESDDVVKKVLKVNPTATSNSIMTILRLYKQRGLLRTVENNKAKGKKGRPTLMFSLTGHHILYNTLNL